MREALLGVLMAAVLAGSARADVFVPDDPPPRATDCLSTAGDVTVATSDARVELSEAGGAWRRLRGIEPCPRVVAAADGTAAIVSDTRVAVRPPGGSFGAPVSLGLPAVSDVAVAPGGWVALARDGDGRAVLTTLAPDGSRRSAEVTRALDEGPVVGIDAGGNAVVAWTTLDLAHDRSIVHVRRGPFAEERRFPARSEVAPALAVSPAGHVGLAWADGAGVQVVVDGAAPERLSSDTHADWLSAAVGDDGAAVVAYRGRGGPVSAADRAAGGAWSLPHVLRRQGDAGATQAVIAPDGRAAVAWLADDAERSRVFAAAGRPGGTWEGAAALSAVTRDPLAPGLTLDAAGTPRVWWTEVGRRPVFGFRAARLVPGAAPDAAAPTLTTRLPGRTRRTRTGRIRLRIPVTCSEACDARVRLLRRGRERLVAVREIPAGRATTFVLRGGRSFGNELLVANRAGRFHLDVLVTDRAGNVARERRALVVPVVRRSVLDFRVGARHDFDMASRAGDRAVGRFVNRLIEGLARREIRTFPQLARRFDRGVAAIRRRHPEVDDALGEVFLVLQVPCGRVGLDPAALVSP